MIMADWIASNPDLFRIFRRNSGRTIAVGWRRRGGGWVCRSRGGRSCRRLGQGSSSRHGSTFRGGRWCGRCR
ncbi:hypothetical protein [Kitasatospora indigofera]|uniref:hypothetical protein n=1 Tax=Kitasatospora indigofera TaxID=67307 RepID=UPI003F4AFEBD